MRDLRFYEFLTVFQSYQDGDNEKMCVMEPRSRLERSPPRAGLEPRTALSIGQGLTY